MAATTSPPDLLRVGILGRTRPVPIGAATAMTAMPDPTLTPLQPDSAATGDPLEQWLGDLRTDLPTDPPDWITTGPAGDHPTGTAPDEAAIPGPPAAEATTIGRH